MNQMNEAHRKKLRAQEYVIWIRIYCSNKKLQTLVERAYKVDPRVLAWKKEQERLRKAEIEERARERREKKRIMKCFMNELNDV